MDAQKQKPSTVGADEGFQNHIEKITQVKLSCEQSENATGLQNANVISVLHHPLCLLAKRWQADGKVKGYDDGKYFQLEQVEVRSVDELSKLLSRLESDPHACVIRDRYVGDELAKEREPETKRGKVLRRDKVFEDQPLNFVMLDVDGFEPPTADPLREPVAAIEEYIFTALPDEFKCVSYHWQLSNSAGRPDKQGLRAHVWFWLKTAYTSAELKAWAMAGNVNVDKKLFDPVQIHYTANPVFDKGVADPVKLRSGFVDGLISDVVELNISPDILSQAKAVATRDELHEDSVALALIEQGFHKSWRKDGSQNIICPRHENHSNTPDEDSETTTVHYLPHTGGYASRAFDCKHASCDGRPLEYFLEPLGITETVEGDKPRLTEFGNAQRMINTFGKELMFESETQRWYTWQGCIWNRATPAEIGAFAQRTIKALPEEATRITSAEERTAFFRFCAISQKSGMVASMIKLAESDPRVMVRSSDLDKDHHLLGVGNGVIDLRTGELFPPDPAYRITVGASVHYNPDAKAPLFEKTVSDAFFDDPEMISFFQRVIGYALLGQPDEDKLIIPYGEGSNGKSTILSTIRQTLGGHAKNTGADTFVSNGRPGSNAGAPREDLLRLMGSRLVFVEEIEEGGELREAVIKSMTGGDPISARGIHARHTVEIIPTWTVFMATNHRPIVKGDDYGIWRRLLLIPFTRNFDKDKSIKKDPHRAAKLAEEREGILCWCVQGALEYQSIGLHTPCAVASAGDDYRESMDLLKDWLEQRCETGQGYAATSADLWTNWKHFAESTGELRFISSSRALGRRLSTRFSPIRDTNGIRGRGFRGLRLKERDEFD